MLSHIAGVLSHIAGVLSHIAGVLIHIAGVLSHIRGVVRHASEEQDPSMDNRLYKPTCTYIHVHVGFESPPLD